MQKLTMSPGANIFLSLSYLYGDFMTYLNGESKYFTALLNEGEDDYESVSRFTVLRYTFVMLLGILFISFIGGLDQLIINN